MASRACTMSLTVVPNLGPLMHEVRFGSWKCWSAALLVVSPSASVARPPPMDKYKLTVCQELLRAASQATRLDRPAPPQSRRTSSKRYSACIKHDWAVAGLWRLGFNPQSIWRTRFRSTVEEGPSTWVIHLPFYCFVHFNPPLTCSSLMQTIYDRHCYKSGDKRRWMADNRGLCDKNTQMISCGRFTGFYVILTGTGERKKQTRLVLSGLSLHKCCLMT